MDALERNLLLQFLRKNNGDQTLTAGRTLLYAWNASTSARLMPI
jgi:hypothetical protein